MRKQDKTHREISLKLDVSISTVHAWCVGIILSKAQKEAIERRRNVRRMTPEEKAMISVRLAPYRTKYTDAEALKNIQDFFSRHGRIPLKREFNAWDTYSSRFGSWNNAIIAAGFEPNNVLFTRRFIANDGHVCDSFSEKIIDDWLSERDILHMRNVPYMDSRFTADFQLSDGRFVEFFGLAGVQKRYDANIEKKRGLAQSMHLKLVELYPADLYPEIKLSERILY